MKSTVLNEIKEFAKKKLIENYGCCGEASSDNVVILISEDTAGHDIKITLKLEVE